MDELRALLELLSMLVTDPRTGVLLLLLAAAAVSDYRTFRIPNLLTGGGILFALVYNTLVAPAMHADWTWAPAGMLLGFGAMLPMYALRIMGAGDVKLMAMVGAFLGAAATVTALLFCVVTAGVAALAWSAHHRLMGPMLANVHTIIAGMWWSSIASGQPRLQPEHGRPPSVGKLAYGVSIAVGTAIYLVANQLNFV
ncbi:A24 family peptidase [Massilia psychrophila]|uniref:Prepilin peptidase n=1 Tax=Massilia psychrophila TaxID=1603353 RepID=A0A2G8SXY8_9BURK|nr:prepilin peptidase [Massilia psychrophila]PIL38657.1 prepilin peptidase [Massilia psychrophila]GGE81548.1 pilus assembly-related outer membrane protein [Massilia psychrophila]